MNIAQKSARYADLSDVSASAKFCVVVMERGNIRAFPSVRPMITDENREDGDGGKMTYLSKGTIHFLHRLGLCKCARFLSYATQFSCIYSKQILSNLRIRTIIVISWKPCTESQPSCLFVMGRIPNMYNNFFFSILYVLFGGFVQSC